MKKVLMMAHVASMIDLFNMDNIHLLQEMGYEVDVACNFKDGNVTSSQRVNEFRHELSSAGIKTYQIPVPRRITAIHDIIRSYIKIRQLAEKNNYELVHCQSPIGGVIARLACKKARIKGTKVIYVAHGFHFYKGASMKNWLLFYSIEKYCARYTDCLITMNQEDYQIAKRKMKKAKRIEYIPGVGIDTQMINNIQVDVEKKRKEIGLPENATVIVSVGELNKNKNHEVIIKALAITGNPNIHYVICGQGSCEEYLIKLSKKLEIEKNIHVLGFRKDVTDILKASDIFAFPSIREGLSVALMEAMAAGLPVMCSKIRGNTDLIKEGEGGYMFDPTDVKEVTSAMQRIINSDTDLGVNNLQIIKKYDIGIIYNIMSEIYRKCGMGD